MIRVALESFASRDAATAESLTDLDEVLDNLNREGAARCWHSARACRRVRPACGRS